MLGMEATKHRYDYICDFDKKISHFLLQTDIIHQYINELLDPNHMPKHIYIYIFIYKETPKMKLPRGRVSVE